MSWASGSSRTPPLGRGFLSGQIQSVDDLDENDFRRHNPRFTSENFGHNFQLVDRVRQIAREKNITPAQLALAWVLQQGVVPIPGTKRVHYLEENAAAIDIKLGDDELARKPSRGLTRLPAPAGARSLKVSPSCANLHDHDSLSTITAVALREASVSLSGKETARHG